MILNYLSFLSIVIFGFLTMVLFAKKWPGQQKNRLLAFFFLATTLSSSFLFYINLAFDEHSTTMLSYYIPLDNCFLSVMGPCLYGYIHRLFEHSHKRRSMFRYLHVLTVIPSCIYLLYFVPLPEQQRIAVLQQNYIHNSWQIQLVHALLILQMLLYLVACYVVMRKNRRKNSLVYFGSIEIDITLLQRYFLFNIVMILIAIPIYMLFNNDSIYCIILVMAITIQSILMLSKSLWQTSLFGKTLDNEDTLEHSGNSKRKTISISDEEADKYIAELTQIIYEKKLYLKGDCTIKDLSLASEIPRHIISKIINNRLQMNFSDYINEFRVTIAKEILSNKAFHDFTFESIAIQCGFGSKSNFYRLFKKSTNLTPSKYKSQNVK